MYPRAWIKVLASGLWGFLPPWIKSVLAFSPFWGYRKLKKNALKICLYSFFTFLQARQKFRGGGRFKPPNIPIYGLALNVLLCSLNYSERNIYLAVSIGCVWRKEHASERRWTRCLPSLVALKTLTFQIKWALSKVHTTTKFIKTL